METPLVAAAAAGASIGGAGSGGASGPAPFLVKTYEMVDDSATDEIVSWSASEKSFIVWNPPEFSRILLPTYFKHNNFSSFIRQLNTYGFHKIDPERWEFANEDFTKGKKHLLKNIHRRKPIHSHSHPPVDQERSAFEEEIEKLSRQKAELQAKALRFRQLESAAKLQLETMKQRVEWLEVREKNLATFLENATKSPALIELLGRKIDSTDLSAYNKKRRLPQADHSQTISENSSRENLSVSRPELANAFPQDFSNKLTLELSPVVSDMNLDSNSTESSNEIWESSLRRSCEGDLRDVEVRMTDLSFTPDAVELPDTDTSLSFKMDSPFVQKAGAKDGSARDSLQKNLVPTEEGDGHISFHLNLTLASSPLQASYYSARSTYSDQEVGRFPETGTDANEKGSDGDVTSNNTNSAENAINGRSSTEAPGDDAELTAAPAPARTNDHFWEQFLTERPGCVEIEEASSSYRANPSSVNDARGLNHGRFRTTKAIEAHSLSRRGATTSCSFASSNA
ncbi:hypothetical protein Dimus_029825 [Dionaea muscipula]